MKRLKFSILLTLFTLPVCAQTGPLSFFGKRDSILITGNIINFQPSADDNFISFSTGDVNGQSKKTAVKIAGNGSFAVKLYQAFEGDILLNFKSAFVPVYIQPGEPLILQIDAAKINQGTWNRDAIHATGNLAAVNNLLFRFETEYGMRVFQTIASLGDKLQSDSLYAARRMQLLVEQLSFLDKFLADNREKVPAFATWQRNQLIYSAAKDVLFFPFLGKLNKAINEQRLMALIAGIPVNNEQALHNSTYYRFLNMLSSGEEIIININPDYDEMKKQNGYSSVPLYLDKVDAVSGGLARQLLYLQLYPVTTRNGLPDGAIAERFEQIINDPVLRQLMLEKREAAIAGFKPYDLAGLLKKSQASAAIKEKLLGKLGKDTALYIDFWGDWCAPCMRELPNYPSLITLLKDKPVKFIFLSTGTPDKSVPAIKAKFGIDADFINMSNDDTAVMNNIFSFHSYPAHFLLNSNGYLIGILNSISNDAGMKYALDTVNKIMK